MVEEWTLDDKTQRYVAGWLLWFGHDFIGYYFIGHYNFGDNGKVWFNEKPSVFDDCAPKYELVAPDNAE